MAIAEIQVKLGNAWTVSPGDKLILGFNRPLSMTEAADIKQRLAAVLPDIEVIIVDDASHIVVYRPDDPDVVP